jgi:glutathione S-transferase
LLERGTAQLLSRFPDGPFFLGDHFSAVDCVWAPFLERYSVQVPPPSTLAGLSDASLPFLASGETCLGC